MSESLNILKAGRYEARTKGRLATALLEASRQWEIWNLSKAQKSLREAAGLNKSEPICSAVICTSSNGVNVCAEPVILWRRQYRISKPARVSGHTGVTGQACGEGYSRENGRDCIAPMRTTICTELIKCSTVSSNHAHRSVEAMIRIIEREIESEGMQPVRRVHSRNETPVMGVDTKEPDFCNASGTGQGCPSRQYIQMEA